MNSVNLATSLRNFIGENFLFGTDVAYGDDDSLVENGIIDSTGVMELVLHLESTYGIEIADEELVPENLDSVSHLTRFVIAKREETTACQDLGVDLLAS